MRKIADMILVILLVVTLSSCGENVDTIGGFMKFGVYDSKVYYESNEYTLSVDNGIYQITDNGYELVYGLTEEQSGVTIVDGMFLIQENMYDFDNSRHPLYYKYIFVDINTGEVTEIPRVNENMEKSRYYARYLEQDDCILFVGAINSTFYVYDISSNTYIHQYTLGGIDWPVSSSFYINNLLYMGNYYYDYSYIYDFETETLVDVYTIEYVSTLEYYHFYQVYQYTDGIDTFFFDSLSVRNENRSFDIMKRDSDYNEISVFEVPGYLRYDFYGENLVIYEQSSRDGVVSVSIYDLDFNLVRSIDINATCQYVSFINEEMIECSDREDRGALLQTHYLRKKIYSLITGDEMFNSGWVQTSSQAKAINKDRKD